jgi:hypothetical protein
MSEIVLALKNEGNVFFNEKKYAEAIAKYDTPIRVLADEPIPGLQLIILTSRLNAYNKIHDTSAQPMNDVLALLKAWPHDLLEPVFSDDKICKAVYQASLSQQSRGKFMETATMLRACLRHKPNDKSVLAALSRVENSRSEGLEKLKQYRVGPVKDLCIQGDFCVICQHNLEPSDNGITLPCDHGFHDVCALQCMQTQISGTQSVRELESKITCPTCGKQMLG